MCVGGVKLGAMSTFLVASVKKCSWGMFRLCALGTLTEKMRLNLEGQTLNTHSSAPVRVPPHPLPCPPQTPSLEEDSSGAADALWLLTSPEMLVCDPASRVCRDRERWEFTGLDLRSGSELPMFWST